MNYGQYDKSVTGYGDHSKDNDGVNKDKKAQKTVVITEKENISSQIINKEEKIPRSLSMPNLKKINWKSKSKGDAVNDELSSIYQQLGMIKGHVVEHTFESERMLNGVQKDLISQKKEKVEKKIKIDEKIEDFEKKCDKEQESIKKVVHQVTNNKSWSEARKEFQSVSKKIKPDSDPHVKIEPREKILHFKKIPPKQQNPIENKQLQDAPLKEDTLTENKQLQNAPPKEDTLTENKQLQNAPPKEDTLTENKQLQNAPPKEDTLTENKQLQDAPPKEDTLTENKQLQDAPLKEHTPTENKQVKYAVPKKYTPTENKQHAADSMNKIVTVIDTVYESSGRMKASIGLIKDLRDGKGEMLGKIEQYKKVQSEFDEVDQKLNGEISKVVKKKSVKKLDMKNNAKVNKKVEKVVKKLEGSKSDKKAPAVISEWRVKCEELLKLENDIALIAVRRDVTETAKLAHEVDKLDDELKKEVDLKVEEIAAKPPAAGGMNVFELRNEEKIKEAVDDRLNSQILSNIKMKKAA